MAKTWLPLNRKWRLVALIIILIATYLVAGIIPRTHRIYDPKTGDLAYTLRAPLNASIEKPPKTYADRTSPQSSWYEFKVQHFGSDMGFPSMLAFLRIRYISPRDCDYATSPEELQSQIDTIRNRNELEGSVESCFSPYSALPTIRQVGSHTLYSYAGSGGGVIPSHSYIFSDGKMLQIWYDPHYSDRVFTILETLQF